MISITRKAEFSASHFCASPFLTEEQNQALYGKGANPNGHGHNYVVEVTVEGEVDPVTGMVMDLKELKGVLQHSLQFFQVHHHSGNRIYLALYGNLHNVVVPVAVRIGPFAIERLILFFGEEGACAEMRRREFRLSGYGDHTHLLPGWLQC